MVNAPDNDDRVRLAPNQYADLLDHFGAPQHLQLVVSRDRKRRAREEDVPHRHGEHQGAGHSAGDLHERRRGLRRRVHMLSLCAARVRGARRMGA